MTDVKVLDELARLGREMIQAQLFLASKEPQEAVRDRWVLGYCFGVFDALGQGRKLDQYTGGIALISIGFSLLLSDHLEGAGKVGDVIDNQTDPQIMEGIQAGGADVYNFLQDTSKAPLALFGYLIPASSEP